MARTTLTCVKVGKELLPASTDSGDDDLPLGSLNLEPEFGMYLRYGERIPMGSM